MATSKVKKYIVTLWVLVALSLIASIAYYAYLKNRRPTFTVYKDFGISIPDGYFVHGIDISHHEGIINWDMALAMRSHNISIQFVIVKATQGINYVDERFNDNMLQLKNHNMVRGAYHYLKPNISGTLQAQHFINQVKLKKGDLFPILDVEETSGVSYDSVKICIQEWLQSVERHFGVKPIVYSNAAFYNQYLKEYTKQYPLWIAHYTSSSNPAINRPWIMWQYSENATISGINDLVDFNSFYGTYEQFKQYTMP